VSAATIDDSIRPLHSTTEEPVHRGQLLFRQHGRVIKSAIQLHAHELIVRGPRSNQAPLDLAYSNAKVILRLLLKIAHPDGVRADRVAIRSLPSDHCWNIYDGVVVQPLLELIVKCHDVLPRLVRPALETLREVCHLLQQLRDGYVLTHDLILVRSGQQRCT